MQEWLGHITATIVAGAVLLIIFAAQLGGQEASISTTQYRAAKIGAVNMALLLETDLRNLGAYFLCDQSVVPLTEDFFQGVVGDIDTTSADLRYLELTVQTIRCQPPVTVRYEWTSDGSTVNVSGESKAVWTLRRLIEGQPTALTSETITTMRFKFRGCDGLPAVKRSLIRRVEVELRMVSPLGVDNLLQETRWTTVVHPLGMTLNDWQLGNCIS